MLVLMMSPSINLLGKFARKYTEPSSNFVPKNFSMATLMLSIFRDTVIPITLPSTIPLIATTMPTTRKMLRICLLLIQCDFKIAISPLFESNHHADNRKNCEHGNNREQTQNQRHNIGLIFSFKL